MSAKSDLKPWMEALPPGDPLRVALAAARADTPDRARLDRVYGAILGAGPVGPGGGGEGSGPGGRGADANGPDAVTPPIVIPPSAPLPIAAGGAAAATLGVKGFGATALGKLIGVALVGSASVATAVWIASPAAPPPNEARKIASAAQLAPASEEVAPRVEARPPIVAAPPTERQDPAAARTATSATSASQTGGPVADPGVASSDPDAEMALLREAQIAAASAPSRALELLDDAERRFPRSAMAQERSVLRVQALLAAGRRDEALSRARAFLAANPGTAHRPRLEQLLPELIATGDAR